MTICTLTKAERKEIEGLLNDLNQARQLLINRLTEFADEWEEAREERSDKWKESDAGGAAEERIDNLQAMIDEIPDEIALDLDSVS